MKSWIREVRALTASMVELRGQRAQLMNRCCELRGGLPLGSAQFLLHLGLSRGELLAMQIEEARGRDDSELLDTAGQLRQIDSQIEALEQRVRAIAAAAIAAGVEAETTTALSSPCDAANVVPFRQRQQPHLPAVGSFVEVA